MEGTVVYAMAGGRGERLRPLTDVRAEPAAPFDGIFRIIDFTLSDCLSSVLKRIYVLTQCKSHSLSNHPKSGWNMLSRGMGQLIDEVPAQQQLGGSRYQGAAGAIRRNVGFVREGMTRHVPVLSGDHVRETDYGLLRSVAGDVLRLGRDVIPALVRQGEPVFAYDFTARSRFPEREHAPFEGVRKTDHVPVASDSACWRDVGTLGEHRQANLDLVEPAPKPNACGQRLPVFSRTDESPPTKLVREVPGRAGTAANSIVADGVFASGAVVRSSVIGGGAFLHGFSLVETTALFGGSLHGGHLHHRDGHRTPLPHPDRDHRQERPAVRGDLDRVRPGRGRTAGPEDRADLRRSRRRRGRSRGQRPPTSPNDVEAP